MTKNSDKIRAEIQALQEEQYEVPGALQKQLDDAVKLEEKNIYEYGDSEQQQTGGNDSVVDDENIYSVADRGDMPTDRLRRNATLRQDAPLPGNPPELPPRPANFQFQNPAVNEPQESNTDGLPTYEEALREAAETAGIGQLDDKTLSELNKSLQAVVEIKDPKVASNSYKEISALIGKDEPDVEKISKKVQDERKKGGLKDAPLGNFLAVLTILCGIEDKSERKAALKSASEQFSFLSDKDMKHEERMEKSLAAMMKFTGGQTAVEEQKQQEEAKTKTLAPGGISEETQKKIAKEIAKQGKEFVDANESALSGKDIFINGGKAAIALAMAIAVPPPGMGIVAAGVFLYLTRNFGNNNKALNEARAELEEAKRQAELLGDGGFNIRPQPKSNQDPELDLDTGGNEDEELEEAKKSNNEKGKKEKPEIKQENPDQEKPEPEKSNTHDAAKKIGDHVKQEMKNEVNTLTSTKNTLQGLDQNQNGGNEAEVSAQQPQQNQPQQPEPQQQSGSPQKDEQVYSDLGQDHKTYVSQDSLDKKQEGPVYDNQNAGNEPAIKAINEPFYDMPAGENEVDEEQAKQQAKAAFGDVIKEMQTGGNTSATEVQATEEKLAQRKAAKIEPIPG